jgi:rod shape determining protein RodA
MTPFFKEYFDRTTFLACLALIAIGLLSIYSATFDTNAASSFHKQIMWASFGFVLMIAVMLIPLRVIQRSSMVMFAVSLVTLAAVLAVGHRAYGSQSWFGFAGMGGQPSEFVKITTILALASFFSRSDTSMGNIKDVGIAFGILLLPF